MHTPTRPQYTRRDWDTELRQHGLKLGFEVIAWDGPPVKRSKVLIRCKHKEQWVCPHGQLKKKNCCKVSAKLAENNPAFGKPQWNSGTVGISKGHGFGGRPSEEDRKSHGTLYLVRYLDKSGTHFKIGITRRTLQERLGDKLLSILRVYTATLGRCFDVEQASLKLARRMGWRYSTDSTTELIRGVNPKRWMNLVNALWWILPWKR